MYLQFYYFPVFDNSNITRLDIKAFIENEIFIKAVFDIWMLWYFCIITKIMEDQIITEQIDVIVVGDRKIELINLMLEQDLPL